MILTPKEIERIRKAYHGQPDVLKRLDAAINAEDAVNDAWRRYVAIENLGNEAWEMLCRAMYWAFETCPHVVPPGVGAPGTASGSDTRIAKFASSGKTSNERLSNDQRPIHSPPPVHEIRRTA